MRERLLVVELKVGHRDGGFCYRIGREVELGLNFVCESKVAKHRGDVDHFFLLALLD
jgi:hypothetical protein